MEDHKTITDFIRETSGLEVSPEYNTDGTWSMFDTGGCECEIGEFLYGLVRMMRPLNICETGSYHGLSGSYMALALKKNKRGSLDSIEFADINMKIAQQLWKKLDVDDIIIPHLISSMDFIPDKQYELVLLDSEPMLRFSELERYWDNIAPGGIIVIHDLSWDLGTGAPQFWLHKELLDKRIKNNELQVINFMTPRGLTLMRKVRPEDEIARLIK